MIFKVALSNLKNRPLSTLLTILGIGIAFAFLGIFWSIVENMEHVRSAPKKALKSKSAVSVYVDPELSDRQFENVKKMLAEHPRVKNLNVLNTEETSSNFEKQYGSALTEALGGGIFPVTLRVELNKSQLSAEEFLSTLGEFESIRGVLDVEDAVSSFDLSSKLPLKIINWSWVLFVAVFIVVALLVSHLIRMAFEASRGDIQSLRVLGASRRLMFVPLLVEAAVYGVLGVCVSFIILFFFVNLILPKFSYLLIPRDTEILFLSFPSLFLIFLMGVLASSAGALFSLPLINQDLSDA